MNKTPKPSRPENRLAPSVAAAQGATSSLKLPSRRALLHGAGTGLLAALNLSLLGCGGGNDDNAAAAGAASDGVRFALGGIDGGGTGATANFFISAAIDSTAPLTVNGITVDTAGSLVVDADGNTLTVQQLRPGMSCQIEARAPRPGSGQATTSLQAVKIRSAEQLTAPVQSVDLAGGAFAALGQRVVVTASTVFDGALAQGLAAVQAGALLRVWGQLDLAGTRIVATRIEIATPPATFSLRGALTALDRSAGTLSIGTWQGTADPDLQIPADLGPGTVVRARVAADGQTLLSVAGDALQLPDRVQAEVDGRVTRVDSAQRFAVDGVEVNATGAAWLPKAALLRPGQQVAVRGPLRSGILQAASVTVEPDEPVELQGAIASANSPQRSFVLKGVTVVWTANTRFEGGTARALAPRRRVQVLGRWSADRAQLEAVHIHVEA